MEQFARFMMKELKYSMPAGQDIVNIAGATDRYALYKVGPVLSASVRISFVLLNWPLELCRLLKKSMMAFLFGSMEWAYPQFQFSSMK